MTTRFRRAAFILAALLLAAAHAYAQDRAAVTLTPADPKRWDAAGQIGWLGVNKSEIIESGWNDWYDTASFSGSVGYYWTTHLKTELDVSVATRADVNSYPPVFLPGEPYPPVLSRQHYFKSSAASAGVTYQFFENSWFHPFLGTGVEVTRDATRTNTSAAFFSGRDGRPPVLISPQTTDWETTVAARPFVTGGFKWYVAEHVFIRSDLRTSFSSKGGESVVWRAGVGFDF
jgi:hypothetical protein